MNTVTVLGMSLFAGNKPRPGIVNCEWLGSVRFTVCVADKLSCDHTVNVIPNVSL